MQETWVWSLGQEDPLEEGMATHSSILAWRIPMDRKACRATVLGVAQSWTQLKQLSRHILPVPNWLAFKYFLICFYISVAENGLHTHTQTHTKGAEHLLGKNWGIFLLKGLGRILKDVLPLYCQVVGRLLGKSLYQLPSVCVSACFRIFMRMQGALLTTHHCW